MRFDNITEAAARRLARPHSRRKALGLFAGAAAAVGLGSVGLATRVSAQSTTSFTFVNNTGQTVWPAGQGTEIPNGGGWELAAGQSMTIGLPATWSGRFWARTNCSFDGSGQGSCETGDCGGQLACNGAGGSANASVAEFTLGGGSSKDAYDVSFVDAFNVPITIAPTGGSQCATVGCTANLNPGCPSALQHVDASGTVVACLSACQVFGEDQFCCAGNFASPAACNPDTWPVDYAAYFKSACENAYSYAFDDPTGLFSCTGASGYVITFWPFGAGGGSAPATQPTQQPTEQPTDQPTDQPTQQPGTVSARSTIPAASYQAQNDSSTVPSGDTDGGQDVGWLQNGSWLQYDGIDFGTTPCTQFIARASSGAGPGISGLVEVCLDSLSNPAIGSFAIASTGGWQDYTTVPAGISPTTGVHTVYLNFVSGQSADFVQLHWLSFS